MFLPTAYPPSPQGEYGEKANRSLVLAQSEEALAFLDSNRCIDGFGDCAGRPYSLLSEGNC